LFKGDLMDEVTDKLDIVTWHDGLLICALCSLGESKSDCDVCCSDEKLWSVIVHESVETQIEEILK